VFPVRVRVEDANTFIGKHKKFIVWANNDDLNCWLPRFLIEKGVQLKLIQEPGQVYLAESE
jgi:hypothetical protein